VFRTEEERDIRHGHVERKNTGEECVEERSSD